MFFKKAKAIAPPAEKAEEVKPMEVAEESPTAVAEEAEFYTEQDIPASETEEPKENSSEEVSEETDLDAEIAALEAKKAQILAEKERKAAEEKAKAEKLEQSQPSDDEVNLVLADLIDRVKAIESTLFRLLKQ